MKQFLITVAFIILAVFLVNTFILGTGNDDDTMQKQTQQIGEKMLNELKAISGN